MLKTAPPLARAVSGMRWNAARASAASPATRSAVRKVVERQHREVKTLMETVVVTTVRRAA